jgi:hypothetical protein
MKLNELVPDKSELIESTALRWRIGYGHGRVAAITGFGEIS